MRPGQQNKRGRGRNNNGNNNGGRKGGNPLSRTYDSSGPDVKIRGTAQHIAEKYAALARDAQSSGDNVMAENYLQHAEHYNRIIAAAQAQMQERYQREERDNGERDGGSDHEERGEYDRAAGERQEAYRGNGHDGNGDRDHGGNDQDGRQSAATTERAETARPEPTQQINGSGPQPVIEGTPAEVAMEEEAGVSSPRRAASRRRTAQSRPRRQPRKAAEAQEGESTAEGDGGSARSEDNGVGDSGNSGTPVAAAASD